MADGSGGTPQLDEAKPPRSLMNMLKREAQKSARNMVTPELVEAFAVEVVGLLRRTGYTILTAEEYSELNSRSLAASPGAGELDLTDDEIRQLLVATGPSPLNAMTDEEVANIGGAAPGTYETMQSARSKLRARLDRKDDDG